jgi:heptosyltransferase I
MSLIAISPPSRLCVIRLSAIGDTCHTVPAVRAIQDAWPNTEITWIVGRVEHTLLAGLEGVRFAVLDKSLGWRGYAELRRALPTRRFPLLLHMHASSRANIVSLLVSSPIRLGFDRARGRDFQYYFCNRHLPARAHRHVMDGLLEFPESLGIACAQPRWDIPIGASDRAFAAQVAAGGAPVLVLSPCTGQRFRNFRNWRVERYAEIADYAHDRYGAKVVLTGGTSAIEREYGLGIGKRCRTPPVNMIGQTSLKQLLALLEKAAVVLCPDSGPAHMATAVGTPVVGLYATSNRLRTGPYNSQHLVVDKYPEAVAAEFGTSVDGIRWGRRVRNPDAMDLITVADVKAKLDLAFAERGIAAVSGNEAAI